MLKLPLSILSVSKFPWLPKPAIFFVAAGLSLLFTIVIPFDANSVLIATGDGTGNTTAPPADPGFANVGVVNGLSGVYVGNGWVLTANHVGEHPIVLLGVTYDPVAGSRIRFEDPPSSFADLIAYKLQSKPPLPDLQLTDGPPAVNTPITVVGNGRNRGAATNWMGVDGWAWGGGTSLRWGTNEIALVNDVVFSTHAFRIVFDDLPGQQPGVHESDVVTGDSGGAAFTGSGAGAELVGVLFARASFTNQPLATSLYGNQGVIVDLFAYRNDILAVIDQPDCSDGLDDDGDGLIDFPNDPGCSDASDSDERGAPFECDNGLDDDGDGNFDFPDDSGCENPTDDSELAIAIPTGLLGAGVFALFALGLLARAPRSEPDSPSAE